MTIESVFERPLERPLERNIERIIVAPPGGGGDFGTLSNDLIAYWRLADAANGNRVDETVNGYDLVDALGGIGVSAGHIGNAADLPGGGSSHRLGITNAAAPLLDFQDVDFAISTWAYFRTFGSGWMVLNKWIVGGYELTTRPGDKVAWHVGDTELESGVLATNTWHHFVCMHSASRDEITLVVNDGTPLTAALVGGPQTSNPIAVDFCLGGSSGGAYSLNGLVDDTGVWGRELTGTEITTLAGGAAHP